MQEGDIPLCPVTGEDVFARSPCPKGVMPVYDSHFRVESFITRNALRVIINIDFFFYQQREERAPPPRMRASVMVFFKSNCQAQQT
ncbi:hypothetical protein PDJAM_G00118040 [Pangasius djambal]|uniref:Uncharacterized protein n=1 Tax=Pangasius djambal TaxID=1691987 RepID=A0ACC5Z9W7_9TELE|nr:hypothetical protein [Pangasius djambal]